MNGKKLVIFNGSLRKSGTSYSFARTIKKLAEDGVNTAHIIHIIEYFDGKQNFDSLKDILSHSDIIGLAAPMYVDTLPYPVIWFFEKLSDEMKRELKGKSLFAVSQWGFPDITLRYPLLGSCRCFAEEVGMRWMGGLGYGGGPMINGAFMEDLGKKGARITSALKLALDDVIEGREISPKAQDLIQEKIPRILFYPLAAFMNHMARKNARKEGTVDLKRKYYLE